MSSAADKAREKASRLGMGRLRPPASPAETPAPSTPAVGEYPPRPPVRPVADLAQQQAVDVKPPQPEPEAAPPMRKAPPPPQPRERAKSSRTKPVRTVRMTLDLAPALHADFQDWTTQVSRQLGRGRLARADVLRVLVRELLGDKATQQRVIEALRRETED